MKIAIIGAKGMLGHAITAQLTTCGIHVTGFGMEQLDITNPDMVREVLDTDTWSCIINCAAFTHVDNCETERETAYATNVRGVQNIAQYCAEKKSLLIHFSTDYIFNGKKQASYIETDAPDPINYYGQTKYEGELAIQQRCDRYYIFRIQWLYGDWGTHFVKTILNLAQNQPQLKVVSDQWGSPTSTGCVAEIVSKFVQHRPAFGIYHAASQGYTNWHAFATYFLSLTQLSPTVTAIATADAPRPAVRPLNSRLNCDKLLQLDFIRPATWQQQIETYMCHLAQQGNIKLNDRARARMHCLIKET